MKPGMLSRELKDALGMPDGAPPPWLINMQVCSFNLNSAVLLLIMPLSLANLNRCITFQRYGPPPSYPQLKIPGLNAPIPLVPVLVIDQGSGESHQLMRYVLCWKFETLLLHCAPSTTIWQQRKFITKSEKCCMTQGKKHRTLPYMIKIKRMKISILPDSTVYFTA
jgi:hypothetical protein